MKTLTRLEERELDLFYLAEAPLSAKRQARFEALRERLMTPIYAQAYEAQQRASCLSDDSLDLVTHDPR